MAYQGEDGLANTVLSVVPRMRSMQGSAHVLFANVPMEIDQRFEYRSVNGPDTLAQIDTTKLTQASTHIEAWVKQHCGTS